MWNWPDMEEVEVLPDSRTASWSWVLPAVYFVSLVVLALLLKDLHLRSWQLVGILLLLFTQALVLLVWSSPRTHKLHTLPRPATSAKSHEIDALYAELRRLREREDPALSNEIESRFQRLRELQRQEAEAMRLQFESRLYLKPGEGWGALQQARTLLDEDPSADNSSSSKPS